MDGEKLSFAEKAIIEIRKANRQTDTTYSGFMASYKHFDAEEFSTASNHLITMRKDVVSKITASSPNGQKARKSLGTALHTLQDFYAHSNWVEIGRTGINSVLGRSAMTNPPATTAFCPDDPETLGGAGLTQLTSGYYIYVTGCGDPPDGKCYHGGPGLISSCDGINKDDSSRVGFDRAYSLGSKATTDYLNQILDASGVKGNAKAIKALMRINGTLGMVIDDTGSMGGEINQVQKQVKKIVDNYAGTDKEPDEYLLVRFGDPDVGPALVTTDTSVYLSKVNALSPSGGGDCPEYSQRGLLLAIKASRNDSNIYLFTDASAKDAWLANSVSAAAQAKRIKITALLTGSCSPISPAYYQNAEDTGGQIFILSPSELDKVFDLVRPQLSGDFVTINRTKGTFDSGEEQLTALVDSTISTVVFSATMDAKDSVALMRPDGSLVQEGDSGVTITQLNNGTIITVNDPEFGEWNLSSSGSGSFAMSAQANSPLDIYTFEFVELFEPAGGYRPIAGQPVVDTESIVQSHMIGHYRSAEFRFVDEFGNTIEPLALTTGDPYAAFDEFAGSVTLPDVPFRVAVSGIDESGEEYERLYPTLFRAQTVKVNLDAETETDRLPAGVTTTLRFKVENLGDSTAEFSMNAVDSQSFITRATPTQLTLASGESAVFEVDLHPSEDVADNTEVSLTVTATSTDNSAITNSDTVEMLTAPSNQPPDCSSSSSVRINLWPPNHKFISTDVQAVSGVTDPDGD
ncbi:MAG: hypothetical protein D3920_05680, partial [Candidatus Electrothrix sp. AW2]|nr:hypothetical protein [Candidatus Electrothrix gigas]